MKRILTSGFLLLAMLMAYDGHAQCEAPSIVWDEDGLIINWIEKDGATSHIVRYRETGTFMWTEVEVEDKTFFDISFLETCVTYDFRVRTVCGDDQSPFTPVHQAAANCGTCYAEYCAPAALNDGITFISFVRVDDYENASTFTGTGVEDFRGNPEIVLGPGAEVEVEVRMGEDNFFYDNNVLAYIDFNRDLEFTPDEIIINEPIFEMVPLEKTVDIPLDIDFGISRMRVMIYSNAYNDVDICDIPTNPFWGEVEEYCVVLGELPSACDFDFNAQLDGVSSGQAEFSWTELAAAEAYNYRFKKTSEPDSEWNEFASIEPEGTLTQLDDCTEYEFEVRGVCPFDTSAYKNRIVFNSFCPTNVNEDEFLLTSLSTYPNPWVDQMSLSFTAKEASTITITAIDHQGREFLLLKDEKSTVGENTFSISNTASMASGVYFIKITNAEDRSWYHKTLKIK